jgi:plasmid stabilization system protein ParE
VKITLSPEAADDWSAAIAYLLERNPSAAAKMADRIHSVMVRLAAGEFDGPEHQLRRGGARVRSWPVPPFRLYYRRDPDAFVVLRVYHSARRPIGRSK